MGLKTGGLRNVSNIFSDFVETYEDYSNAQQTGFNWSFTENGAGPYATTARAIEGSVSMTFDSFVNSNDVYYDINLSAANQAAYTSGHIWLKDESGGGAGFSPIGDNGGEIFLVIGDSNQLRIITGDSSTTPTSSSNWHQFVFDDIDYDNQEVTITLKDEFGTTIGSVTNESFINPATKVTDLRFGTQQVPNGGGNQFNTDTFFFDDLLLGFN